MSANFRPNPETIVILNHLTGYDRIRIGQKIISRYFPFKDSCVYFQVSIKQFAFEGKLYGLHASVITNEQWSTKSACRVSSKQTNKKFRFEPKQTETRSVSVVFRVCFVKPKTNNFGLFRCFKPISKQQKQTELFRNKLKQPKIF